MNCPKNSNGLRKHDMVRSREAGGKEIIACCKCGTMFVSSTE